MHALSSTHRTMDLIDVDFVLGLPHTQQGNDSIFVVFDQLSEMVHFIVREKTNDATRIEELFFSKVVHLHGLLKNITSNKDTKFLSHFWRIFWRKLGTKLQFNGAYYPQIHGK